MGEEAKSELEKSLRALLLIGLESMKQKQQIALLEPKAKLWPIGDRSRRRHDAESSKRQTCRNPDERGEEDARPKKVK